MTQQPAPVLFEQPLLTSQQPAVVVVQPGYGQPGYAQQAGYGQGQAYAAPQPVHRDPRPGPLWPQRPPPPPLSGDEGAGGR